MNQDTLEERFKRIQEKFFLFDPVYFMVLCLHTVEFTDAINCSICSGMGKLCLSPSYFNNKSDIFLEESIKVELLRCLLRHPYRLNQRNKIYAYIASNVVCANNMRFIELNMPKPSKLFDNIDFNKECFEFVYDSIVKFFKTQGPTSQSNFLHQYSQEDDAQTDILNKTALWGEDDLISAELDKLLNKVDQGNLWGTIPNSIQQLIKIYQQSKFNYKAIFEQFKHILPCSMRVMTRMKPNRRYSCIENSFGSIGYKRAETAKLLVAVDVSASITQDEYVKAMSFINGFFTTNIETLWYVQWDVEIKENTFQKFNKKIEYSNRFGYGGTDVSCVFDFIKNSKQIYSGCIIFTDGCFSCPDVNLTKCKGTKFLFVLNNKENFNRFHKLTEFKHIGKCTFVE